MIVIGVGSNPLVSLYTRKQYWYIVKTADYLVYLSSTIRMRCEMKSNTLVHILMRVFTPRDVSFASIVLWLAPSPLRYNISLRDKGGKGSQAGRPAASTIHHASAAK